MLSHTIPDIPFYEIAIDIAEFGEKSYLVIVDYYLRWIEILKLFNKTSDAVIEVLKQLFGRLGIPRQLVADNMPFGSFKFREFSNKWNFQIITSSPHYAQSNGLAERGVGIAKDMLKKSHHTGMDIDFYLLAYRNTPISGLQYSPAQLLQSRELRSTMLVDKSKFKPKVVLCHDKILQNKEKQKYFYDRAAKKGVETFVEGQLVYVQDKINKTWSEGEIIKKLKEPRSYKIKTKSGNTVRRNAQWLKKRTQDGYNDFGENNENDTETVDIETENENNENDTETVNNGTEKENESTNDGIKRTKRGRVIKTPKRYL